MLLTKYDVMFRLLAIISIAKKPGITLSEKKKFNDFLFYLFSLHSMRVFIKVIS